MQISMDGFIVILLGVAGVLAACYIVGTLLRMQDENKFKK